MALRGSFNEFFFCCALQTWKHQNSFCKVSERERAKKKKKGRKKIVDVNFYFGLCYIASNTWRTWKKLYKNQYFISISSASRLVFWLEVKNKNLCYLNVCWRCLSRVRTVLHNWKSSKINCWISTLSF